MPVAAASIGNSETAIGVIDGFAQFSLAARLRQPDVEQMASPSARTLDNESSW